MALSPCLPLSPSPPPPPPPPLPPCLPSPPSPLLRRPRPVLPCRRLRVRRDEHLPDTPGALHHVRDADRVRPEGHFVADARPAAEFLDDVAADGVDVAGAEMVA